MIIIVHVPKSGGTSLGKSLQECFDYDRIFSGVTLDKLGWNNGRVGQYIRIAPREKLDSFDLISAHVKELIRAELYPNDVSIAISREPRSRFISLIRHILRENKFTDRGLGRYFHQDGSIHIDDAEEFRSTYLRAASAYFFVDTPWKPHEMDGWEQEWSRMIAESTKNIDHYDLCITTKNLGFYQAFIREALGAPNFGKAERLNTAAQHGDKTDDAYIEKLGEIYDTYLSRENEFFTAFRTKSDTMRVEIEKNRSDWLFWLRGRLAKKQYSWSIDWSKRADALGWSNRELPGDHIYSGRIARLMLGNVSSIDMPLQGGLSYTARGIFWTGNPDGFEHLKVTVNGQPASFKITRPHSRMQHAAVVTIPFNVPLRAANTRIEFNTADCDAKEVWCLDMSARRIR